MDTPEAEARASINRESIAALTAGEDLLVETRGHQFNLRRPSLPESAEVITSLPELPEDADVKGVQGLTRGMQLAIGALLVCLPELDGDQARADRLMRETGGIHGALSRRAMTLCGIDPFLNDEGQSLLEKAVEEDPTQPS